MGNNIKKYNLGFINHCDIYNHVASVVKAYRFKINLDEFKKNIIDPIKLTFDSKVYKKNIKEILEAEIIRQFDKTNSNNIGYFHQNIFKYISKDWDVPERVWDVINPTKHIYVELKNKHNTMNSSSAKSTYIKMQNKILTNPQATCMLVEVIAKKSQNIPWCISLDQNKCSNKQIRRVSIDLFYEIVTGDKHAFKKLCTALPTIVEDVIKNSPIPEEFNTVVKEFSSMGNNLLKNLYLLSFSKYEGFDDDFEI